MQLVSLNKLRAYRLPVLGNAKLRVAQLGPACCFEGAELFLPSRWKRLTVWRPQVLIGSVADLERLTNRMDLGTMQLESVDHSVWVLTGVGDCALGQKQRAALWHRFGVPIYELYADESGVLAYECEAHQGWHIEPRAGLRVQSGELVLASAREGVVKTGLARGIDLRPCACGRAGARAVDGVNELAQEQPIQAAIA